LNRAVELHDSDLGSAITHESLLELRLDPAYVHQSEGRPGIDRGTGWIQTLLVRVAGFSLEEPIPSLPQAIANGSLEIGPRKFDNAIPLPFRSEGPVHLRLLLADSGRWFVVSGVSIEVEEVDEPRYVEQFFPDPSSAG